MSALTDLFTAMANKIRSKTGTATTYTPAEMVSDGIDDVYDAGYAAGGGSATPITPSNSSPASMSSGSLYRPSANGYAIESYQSITPTLGGSEIPMGANDIYQPTVNCFAVKDVEALAPSNSSPDQINTGRIYDALNGGYAISSYSNVTPSNSSPVSLSSGSIYKMGGSGKAVASVTDITPSDSSPAAMTSGTVYKAGGGGYAIASSPTSVTPTSSPTTLSSGSIYKMGGVGYVYNPKPTASFSWTPLWTNSAATSNFAGQTLTIPTVDSYTYLKIEWKRGKSLNTIYSVIVPKADLQQYESESTSANAPYAINGTGGVSRSYRLISLTQVSFGTAYKLNQSGSDNSVAIPTAIYGGNLTTN